MNWSSWSEFAAMGGYGVFVWGSFGVTAAVMLGELLSLRARRKALKRFVHDVQSSQDAAGSAYEG